MSLTYIRYKIKGEMGNMCIYILSLLLSFGLGFLSADDYKRVPIYQISGHFSPKISVVEDEKGIEDSEYRGDYVASKNGKNYYHISCSGVGRINEENKIYFKTKDDAEKQGFKPSKTCPLL